jgi:hypothetical protein
MAAVRSRRSEQVDDQQPADDCGYSRSVSQSRCSTTAVRFCGRWTRGTYPSVLARCGADGNRRKVQ